MTAGRRAKRAPIADLALLRREVNQLFERLVEVDRGTAPEPGAWSPPVDVFECDGALVVVAEVPGLAVESLKVVAHGAELRLSGERRERRPAGARSFLCMERPQGRFLRCVPLDPVLDATHAKARLGGGLLTVTIPRQRERRGRETAIPIEREE